MSTIKRDVNYLEPEPIRSSEVRLRRDKGDIENDTDEDDEMTAIDERNPGALGVAEEEIDTGGGVPVLMEPTVVVLQPKDADSLVEIDDEWDEDKVLPMVEYAPDDQSDKGTMRDLLDSLRQLEDLSEEDFLMDNIDLQHYLTDDIDEDEWESIDGEDGDMLMEVEDADNDHDKGDKKNVDDRMEMDEKREKEEEDDDEDHDNDEYNDDETYDDDRLEMNEKREKVKTDLNDIERDQTVHKNTQHQHRTKDAVQEKQIQTEENKHQTKPEDTDNLDGAHGPSGPSTLSSTAHLNRLNTDADDLTDFVTPPSKPIEILHGEDELNGTNRVAADGIASDEECAALVKLLKMESRRGDGYEDRPYVHTKYELFEGLTVKQATEASKSGRVSMFYTLAYMHIAERSRQFVREYFKLNQTLYFSYTHLVCRTAEPDSTSSRTDLSHPVHADNCQLDYRGNCHKVPPAYVWRDWSAVTYLNDDFEGGDFIFAYANKTIQANLSPKCGRIVAFSAGADNLHGVKGVIKGTRCALALWFTLDPKYAEREFHEAAETITEMYEAVHSKHDEL